MNALGFAWRKHSLVHSDHHIHNRR
jgi:hypothetical protein